MEYCIQGLFIAIGIIAGFIAFGFTIAITLKGSGKIKPQKLLQPFKDYLKEAIKTERYEEVSKLNSIIEKLENDIVPKNYGGYNISKSIVLILPEDETSLNQIELKHKFVIRK